MGWIASEKVTLTVAAAATTATVNTTTAFHGRVVKVEIDPGTLAAAATIKAYQKGTLLATGTRDHFLDYTVPNPAVEVVIYPMFESSSTNANGALTTKVSQARIVDGQITVDLASAVAANSVAITFYVES